MYFAVGLYYLLLAIVGHSCQQQQQGNVTILEQKNVFQLYPPLDQCVLCQNLTDKYGMPVLKAADDMSLPPLDYFRARGVAHGLDDCSQMSFTLTTLRRKNDLNPAYVTLEFMRHNVTTGGPSLYSKPFYKKTYQWPTNNYLWQSDYLNRPWDSVFTLQYNEVGDDGVTRFNFRDTTNFMRVGETVWVSYYATMPFHLDQRFVSNSMQWNTLNNVTGSSPVQRVFDSGAVNHDFVFLDAADFLRQGFTQWTTALSVEQAMHIPASTNNMAWQVSLLCLVDRALLPTVAPIPPTLSPTAMPTTSEPTVAPTAATTNSSDGPLAEETNNTWSGNHTLGGAPSLHALWLSLIPITLILCGIGVAYFLWRQRRKIRLKSGGQATEQVAGNPLHHNKDDGTSLASFFESEDALSATATISQQYFAHNNVKPTMMTGGGVSYDHNNPFSRRKPSPLLQVTISEDDDDYL